MVVGVVAVALAACGRNNGLEVPLFLLLNGFQNINNLWTSIMIEVIVNRQLLLVLQGQYPIRHLRPCR